MSLSEDASQAARNATMLLVFVFKIDRTDDCYVQRESYEAGRVTEMLSRVILVMY